MSTRTLKAGDDNSKEAGFVCQNCGSQNTRRSQRRVLEWLIGWLLLPYRCRHCNERFYKWRFVRWN
jgi:hypothetical protein